jgi:hypothetical protein
MRIWRLEEQAVEEDRANTAHVVAPELLNQLSQTFA